MIIIRFFLVAALVFLSSCSWIGTNDWFTAEKGNPVDEKKVAELTAFPFEQMAPEAPPPPKPEFRPPVPGTMAEEYTWRNGYWTYKDGTGFSWNPGYWLRKPAFSAVWRQDLWLQRAYGWTLVPGHWQ